MRASLRFVLSRHTIHHQSVDVVCFGGVGHVSCHILAAFASGCLLERCELLGAAKRVTEACCGTAVGM
jgi:hypothetical protein